MARRSSSSRETIEDARRLLQSGQGEAAAQICRRLIRRSPRATDDPWRILASIEARAGAHNQAIETLSRAIRARSRSSVLHVDLARLLMRQGDQRTALAVLSRAVELDPSNRDAVIFLARRLLKASHPDSAARMLDQVSEQHAADSGLALLRGHAALNQGLNEVALEHYDIAESLEDGPPSRERFVSQGTALRLMGRLDEARRCFESALTIEENDADAIAGLVQCLESLGDSDSAYRRAIDALDHGWSSTNLIVALVRVARRLDRRQEAVQRLEGALRAGTFDQRGRMAIFFNLGALREDLQDYDGAFDAWTQGNALYPQRFRAADRKVYTDGCLDTFTMQSRANAVRSTRLSSLPVFIVGMPRSGTSLVEQILASHPEVHGAGELTDLVDIAQTIDGYPAGITLLDAEHLNRLAECYLDRISMLAGHGSQRVTDKMPMNYQHLGLIDRILPDALVIHCRRHPLDVCLSCYATALTPAHTYATSLDHIADLYLDYRRMMTHWRQVLNIRIFEIDYESLIDDTEGWTRRLIEFIGVDWSDTCLEFHRSDRVVATASMDQVRRPIYRSSMARHERFRVQLAALRQRLERELGSLDG